MGSIPARRFLCYISAYILFSSYNFKDKTENIELEIMMMIIIIIIIKKIFVFIVLLVENISLK